MSIYAVKRPESQQGMLLLEALIAILIFSLGILGILGLQTNSAKQASDAKFRSDAALLAEELIGKMWVTNRQRTTLVSQFASPNGTAYISWLGSLGSPGTVRAILPGADVNPPTVQFTDPASNQVRIEIDWQAPYEVSSGTVHKYVVVTQID